MAEILSKLPAKAAENPALACNVLMKKDGKVFPTEMVSSTNKPFERSLIGYVDQDITERKQAEKALRESENRVQDINKEILNICS